MAQTMEYKSEDWGSTPGHGNLVNFFLLNN